MNFNKILVSLLVLFACAVKAQVKDTMNSIFLEPKTESILNLKPEEDAKTKVTISNLVETNVYEAPNIITVITDEDIERMGYTDMLDILNNVPGITIATDIQNGTAIGIRGNWAEEGKVQFMIDGLIMNDLAYGSVIMGHRFPIANISRIEIIRGAGSAIYGGMAALGVINIITKKGQQLNGSYLTFGGGVSNWRASRGMINYTYGGYLLKGIELSVTGLVNGGKRSNEKVVLPDSTEVNFKDSSIVNNIQVQFGLKYKSLQFKVLYEDYNFQSTYEPIASLVRTFLTEVSNQFTFKKIKIRPYLNSKWQIPWNTQYGDPTIYDAQNLIASNTNMGCNGDLNAFDWLKFNFGFQYYNNTMKYHRISKPLYNGETSQLFHGSNGYIESQFISKFVNLTAGARFEGYTYFPLKILPRVSLTKSFNSWHYKLLYGESYKLPTLQNINLNLAQDISPEEVIDMQAELGYDGKNFSASIVSFNTKIKNMILFGYDLTNFTESYVNGVGTINTAGFEFETKYKTSKFIVSANYSNYFVLSNSIQDLMIDTNNFAKGNLAMPKHKTVLAFHYLFSPKFSAGVNYVYQNQKFGFTRINSITDEYDVIRYSGTHMINLVFKVKGLFSKIIDMNFGLNNVLNTKQYYLYPYRSGYFNTVSMGRELFVQFKFNL